MSSYTLDIPNPTKKSERTFNLPNRLIVGAGPANYSPRVIAALTRNTTGGLCDELYAMKDDIKRMLQYIYQTKNECTMAMQLTGTGGIEVILTNLVDPGEKVIVAVGGVWGERTVEKAKIRQLDVVALTSNPGEVFTFDELEREIIKHKPVLLFITHGEASAGTNQPLDELGEICHKHGCLLAVDAVVSLGGVPLYVDRWKIDAVVSATQKAIGAPAGIALMTFSPKAVERARQIKVPPPLYFSLIRSGNAWKCFGTAKKYHYTYNSHMVCCVREALAQICEEGIDKTWKRHEENARRFWKGLESMGLKLFVKKEMDRLWTVTPIEIPPKVKWPVLMNYLEEKDISEHNVVISCGLGPTYNKTIRIGIMGYNSRPEVVDYVLEVLEKAIKYCRSEEGQIGLNSIQDVM